MFVGVFFFETFEEKNIVQERDDIFLFKYFQKETPTNQLSTVRQTSGVTWVCLNSRAVFLCKDNILLDISST